MSVTTVPSSTEQLQASPGPPSDGVRLSLLEMVRVTEQTALVANLALGLGWHPNITQKRTVHRGALQRMKMCLMESMCLSGNKIILCTDLTHNPRDRKKEWREIAQFNQPVRRATGRFETPPTRGGDPANWRLEYILSPVDGLDGLLNGSGGAACFLAGGVPGWCKLDVKARGVDLLDDNVKLEPAYLVVVLGRGPAIDPIRDKVADAVGRLRIPDDAVISESSLCGVDQWLSDLVQAVGRTTIPTISTMEKPLAADFRGALGRFGRVRALPGSPVLAAISSMLPELGVPLHVSVQPHSTTTLISMAAITLGARICAIPLRRDALPDRRDAPTVFRSDTQASPKPLTERHFVLDDRCFLLGTGVTDHPALNGVRFVSPEAVSTSSMSFYLFTRTRRDLVHHHNISTDAMYAATSGMQNARSAMGTAWSDFWGKNSIVIPDCLNDLAKVQVESKDSGLADDEPPAINPPPKPYV